MQYAKTSFVALEKLLQNNKTSRKKNTRICPAVYEIIQVQDIATKIGESGAEVHRPAGENKKLKQRTEQAEQENGKLKEELKKEVQEKQILKDTLQFAKRLEVNGKPFIEAYGAYKGQEKQQLAAAEKAKKQQKPQMTKVKGRRL